MYSCMTKKSVRDHCFTMMSHFNRVEVMRAKLEQIKIDMILKSLLESFNHFKMNYNMIRKDFIPTQLMHVFESVEEFFGKQNNIYHTESYSKHRRKPKCGKKNKKKA